MAPPPRQRRSSSQVRALRPATPGSGPDGDQATRRTERAVSARRRFPLGPVIVGGIVVVALSGWIAWAPIERSVLLGRLDDCPPDAAHRTEAEAAADAFIAAVGTASPHVRSAISEGHGPVTAQIRMAERVGAADLLLVIVARPGLEPGERLQGLEALLRAPEGSWHELPADLASQLLALVQAPDSPPALVRGALAVLTRANDRRVWDVAFALADHAADPELVRAGLDALAGALVPERCAAAFRLFAGRNAATASGHAALVQALQRNVGPELLGELVLLLDHPVVPVRAAALACLDGGRMSMPDGPAAAARRMDLGIQLGSRLARAPDGEVGALVAAIFRLRLIGASPALVANLPRVAPLVPADALARTLGEALIFKEPADQRELSARHLDRLVPLIDRPECRAVAVASFARVRDPGFAPLRDALDHLAAAGDPASLGVLADLTDNVFVRTDVTKAAGGTSAGWRRVLAADRTVIARLREINAWIERNGGFIRISDGKAKLGECRTWLVATAHEIEAWVADPAFVAPLGWQRSAVNELVVRLHTQLKMVNQAWSGAN